MRLKLQKVRPGEKYESYRLSIPKSIIHVHQLENCEFDVHFRDGNLIFKPIRLKKKK
jgi:hypothetical protein